MLTDAPLFVTKAKLMPGSIFVVGVDTAVRCGPLRCPGVCCCTLQLALAAAAPFGMQLEHVWRLQAAKSRRS